MFPKCIQVSLHLGNVYDGGGGGGGGWRWELLFEMLIGFHIWGAYIQWGFNTEGVLTIDFTVY